MAYAVRYTAAARAELKGAYAWYAQPTIRLGGAFAAEVTTAEHKLRHNPKAYQRVDQDMRRVNLRRFPYALTYLIVQRRVLIIACLHHHQRPRTRQELLER